MKTAFPLNSSPVSIRLYANIPFDNTYKNHTLISTHFKYNNSQIYSGTTAMGEPKERFINRKITATSYYYPRYDLTGEFNFDFSNGLIGSVVLELTPEQTNANYLRVKVGDSINGYEYYYYFITGINQINVDTYRLSLELDVIMTYQDEFLSGMIDVPVFTTRKHCHRYTLDGLRPMCADLKTGDETFGNVKPSIITDIFSLRHDETTIHNIRDIVWLYICADYEETNKGLFPNFTCAGVNYPFSMLALPLNCDLVLQQSDGTTFTSFSALDIRKCIVETLINNGSIHGAKLSNYPPFVNSNTGYVSLVNGTLTLRPYYSEVYGTGDSTMYFGLGKNDGKASFFIAVKNATAPAGVDSLVAPMSYGALLIQQINSVDFRLRVDAEFLEKFKNTQAPTILSNRYQDPKLLFSPFKKYILGAKYSSDGWELHPELAFSEYSFTSTFLFFHTISTVYIGDMSCYTFIEPIEVTTGDYAFKGYGINRIGLAGTMNYTMPVGENALEVFNATQQNSFYQSKVASGITSGLSIAGGIGSIALGANASALGLTAPAGVGLIAGGITAISSGFAGIANSVKSATAKIEDLKNTPDSINIAGSSYISDSNIDSNYKNLPFITIYDVSSVIKENANDYFYNYGYQVARECYFNYELKYAVGNHQTDNNLFGRTIFNYIQTNDDITNKINYDIPLIIKQKLNAIFNNGITLWTYFGNDYLWKNGELPTVTTDPDLWFMKCILDNTEYKE